MDGRNYSKKELLKKMVDDTFYYGELNKLALSSSSLKLLLSSPKTYKYVTEYGSPETQPLRDGRLVHQAILEPQKFSEQIFVNVSSKNSKTYKEAREKYGEVYTRLEKENAEKMYLRHPEGGRVRTKVNPIPVKGSLTRGHAVVRRSLFI